MKGKKKSIPKTPAALPLFSESKTGIFLFLTALLVYINTINNDYALDDAIVITENSFTKQGVSGIKSILTHDAFYGFFQQEGKSHLVSGGRYRPLSQVTFAMEYSIFGLKPGISHLVNILLFAFTGLLLFRITYSFSRFRMDERSSLLFAGLVTFLFIVHPIHTEAVANIKGRDELLALLLGMGALYSNKRGLETWHFKYFWYSGLFIFLALLSKENALAFLILIPLTFYFFTDKSLRRIMTGSLFLLAGSGFYFLLRLSVLGWITEGSPVIELMNNPFLNWQNGTYVPMTWMEKMPMVLHAILEYFRLLIFPYPLSHDYYPWSFNVKKWTDASVILALILSVTQMGMLLWKWKNRHFISYVILFFWVSFFLVSNVIFPIGTLMSERFMYIPSIAICLSMSGLMVHYLWPSHKTILIGLVILVGGGGFFLTIQRNTVWKDNLTLFTTDVKHQPNSAKLRNAVGGELISQAIKMQDSVQKADQIREAIGHLNRAVELHPLYKNAFLLLGNAHYYLKRYEEALGYFDQALKIDPGYPDALFNRAFVYRDLGRYYGESLGDLSRAVEYLEKAVLHLQDDYETNRLLGVAYGNINQPLKAIDYFSRALRQKEDAWTNFNLGIAYLAIGDSVQAKNFMDKARRLNPQVGK